MIISLCKLKERTFSSIEHVRVVCSIQNLIHMGSVTGQIISTHIFKKTRLSIILLFRTWTVIGTSFACCDYKHWTDNEQEFQLIIYVALKSVRIRHFTKLALTHFFTFTKPEGLNYPWYKKSLDTLLR